MKVVIAHEWLTSYAGSESVVREMLRIWPDARVLTTVMDPEAVPSSLRAAEPSALNRIRLARRRHQWFVPLMPLAWRTHGVIDDADVVISSSHACANAIRVADGIPHISYCHTPMRYAWGFEDPGSRTTGLARPLARVAGAALRRADRHAARRIDHFIANSSAVSKRIHRVYGREARVIHPPVNTGLFRPTGTERRRHFVFVGRLVSYKRPDLAMKAVAGTPHRLIVVGDGPMRTRLAAASWPNVQFVGRTSRRAVRDAVRNAIALLNPGVEDFGIAMAEALAAGTPVIAQGGGGALDLVQNGANGHLVDFRDLSSVRELLDTRARISLDRQAIANSAAGYSRDEFRRRIRSVVERLGVNEGAQP